MRIKITAKEEGAVPSETVVTIPTTSGPEDVVVHATQVSAGGVEVGYIRKKGTEVLVELPRESVSGRWRVWVSESEVAA
jgi:hypothetical protein